MKLLHNRRLGNPDATKVPLHDGRSDNRRFDSEGLDVRSNVLSPWKTEKVILVDESMTPKTPYGMPTPILECFDR